MSERFVWGKNDAPKMLTNNDLVCKDCVFKYTESATKCYRYSPLKPSSVLYGHECPVYKKEDK